MTGFELQNSGVGSDRISGCVATTARMIFIVTAHI